MKYFKIFIPYLAALVVGIGAGCGAIIFRSVISIVHNFLFYGQFDLHYNANLHSTVTHPAAWIILVPVIGSLMVTWLVTNFAPEAKGHGVPEILDALYNKNSKIRPIVAFIKTIASAISIGSGGSVGREGPIAQIGATIGSVLGYAWHFPTSLIAVLVAAGAGAGIAATFNTPFGGIVFALELMLLTLNVRTITLVTITVITANFIGQSYFGAGPTFDVSKLIYVMPTLSVWQQVILTIPVGLVLGFVSILFIHSIYWAEDLFEEIISQPYLRHALGMLAVGVMIYLLMIFAGHYYVQGVGYATILDVFNGLLHHPLWLLGLFLLKLLSTCLTLGSGASGGIFSPSLFMGATLGAAIGLIAQVLLPSAHLQIIDFALAGMAGLIAGTTGAFLTAGIMILEMTHHFGQVSFVLISAVIAYFTRAYFLPHTIYTLKISRRGGNVPEGIPSVAIHTDRPVTVMMTTQFHILKTLPSNPVTIFSVIMLDGVIKTIFDPSAALPCTHFLTLDHTATQSHTLKQCRVQQTQYALVKKDNDIIGIVTPTTIIENCQKTTDLLWLN